MAFYDVGTGDLRELWESYLSEPVSMPLHKLILKKGKRWKRPEFFRKTNSVS